MAFGNGGTTVDHRNYYISRLTSLVQMLVYITQHTKKLLMIIVLITQILQEIKLETRHVSGTNYTDIFATCLLDYGEPEGQDALDNATENESLYVFR